ncbi:hypothetical protein M231_02926 [Tremella mesenterica]|uniref:MIF4G domain-containing protein n=1 Tax=Tremella mesenterica TaxID=5217 RepID=A0A4Q1BPB9_TREME|nr:hypothetical protein M231_02926 [Tremella mesenterica]
MSSGSRSRRPSSRGPRLPATLLAQVAPQSGLGRQRSLFRKPSSGSLRVPASSTSRYANRNEPVQHVGSRPNPQDRAGPSSRPQTERSRQSTGDAKGKRNAIDQQRPSVTTNKRSLTLRLPEPDEDVAEDEEIAWLEYALHKEKDQEGGDDGLDELISFADSIGPKKKRRKRGSPELESTEESSVSHGGDVLSPASSTTSTPTSVRGVRQISPFPQLDHSQGHLAGTEHDDEQGPQRIATTSEIPPSDAHLAVPSVTTSQRYLPPHLRSAQLAAKAHGDVAETENRRRLERKSQNLLNKVSEASLGSILAELEELYHAHSRNDVTTVLTDLIIQMISSRSNLLGSFVTLYATLVGALYRVIGTEFGAHFVYTLVSRYNTLAGGLSPPTLLAETIYETPDASKEGLNLLTLIAELYNAQVVSARLIYDLIRHFLNSGSEAEVIGEQEVEGLLKIMQSSGQQLRSDDSASLTDIVGVLRGKIKGKESTLTSRARFMIETLSNLKNGKQKSTQSDALSLERRRKFLSGLGRKQRLMASEPLRVSLNDLLNADVRGKWWLVGAGWSGNPLAEVQPTRSRKKTKIDEEQALLKIARKQGMNTDIRKAVFIVLMTSEDYIHACDRLSALTMTEVQQREHVRVALHCCGTYALWDFLRELGEDISGESSHPSGKLTRSVGKERIVNLAKTLAYLVARNSIDLTIFRILDFTSLQTSTHRFLANFLSVLMLSTQTTSPLFSLPRAWGLESIDHTAIENIFHEMLDKPELAQGWAFFIKTKASGRMIEKVLDDVTEGQKHCIGQGLNIVSKILSQTV